ncbi:FRG domain-containing protein (plasmid) [Cupriavidus sp. P-10]|uniref:FRG domain-containing protein n=1 Tax=Cupriavidus sp. P-10 TaxID=2027911 RepID=UPI0011C0E3CA|nr:FRG domain-containing protein [Cupriavidus sp. P-10]BDB29513.1 FRG domain-containing protein [Cupriavidus sp. P-10]
MAELQYFGTIEIDGSTSQAMLCMDSDASDTGLLTWFSANTRFLGARVTIQRALQNWTLTVKMPNVFEHRDGQLRTANLTEEDRLLAGRLSATLVPQPNGFFEGYWIDPDENIHHKITLYPAARARVKAQVCESWEEFKSWASRIHDAHAVAYRGQADNKWSLQTSLYRAGRSNLLRYRSDTLNEFHNHLEALTGLHVDRHNPSEFGRMIAIAQHQGLPTPLLDWTQSPYIAAWFALSDSLNLPPPLPPNAPGYVRVYALTTAFRDAFAWDPAPPLDALHPFAAFVNFSARDNPRLYAQQGRFVMTNIGDLESYLLQMQSVPNGFVQGKTLLVAADIPRSVAPQALKDLALMGVTAATMFPGLEGACRMLKQQMLIQERLAPPVLPTIPGAGIPSLSTHGYTPGSYHHSGHSSLA